MIQIRGISKKYKDNVIYEKFNMDFEEQKITSILGPSGCGKTTLLRMIAGLEPYQKGEITGVNQKKIAYIFQEDRLIPWMNVEDNMSFVLKSYLNEQKVKERIEEVLTMLQLLDCKKYRVQELSGGMQRRVAIGRALAYESELLLMDEPFKGLDSELKDTILDAFKIRQISKPQTMICVTHDLLEASKLSDCIYEWKDSQMQAVLTRS